MSRVDHLAELRHAVPLVGPSLLASDFANLETEIRRVEDAGARLLHVDVMDGHFVPNISLGIPVLEAVRRVTELPLDVHLMISNPAEYIGPFRRAGADLLTIHVEATDDPRGLLDEIRSLGAGAGITLNPPTPVAEVEPYVDACDLVLVMGVMAGFGGQSFQPSALEKLRRLRAVAPDDVLLSIDGGVNRDTIAACAEAGADLFVAGSAVFLSDDYRQSISELTSLARASKNIRV
jgi:ribulose-phosphate 3-epimerase